MSDQEICEKLRKWIPFAAPGLDTLLEIAAQRLESLQRERKEHHDWTPCAEGLPEETGKYWVSFFYYGAAFTEKRDYFAHEKRWGQGGNPVAWMPAENQPEPYNPDHIREATKMTQEEQADA